MSLPCKDIGNVKAGWQFCDTWRSDVHWRSLHRIGTWPGVCKKNVQKQDSRAVKMFIIVAKIDPELGVCRRLVEGLGLVTAG